LEWLPVYQKEYAVKSKYAIIEHNAKAYHRATKKVKIPDAR